MLLLSPVCASGEPAAVGNEFAVNAYTSGMQFEPSVCRGKNGTFVIVYDDLGLLPPPAVGLAPGRDGSGSAVVGARFQPDGTPLGSEFIVNTYTTGDQAEATVACLGDGTFLVAWRDIDVPPDGGRDAIFGRVYDGDGQPAGDAFRVDFGPYPNAFPPRKPSACANGNEFVVVWNSSQFQAVGRRFGPSGVAVGNAVTPENGAVGEDGACCCGSSDGFVVAWNGYASPSGDGDAMDVEAQRFTRSGAANGSVFRANTYTLGDQRAPTLACDAAGRFVLAWTSDGGGYVDPQDGDAQGVFAQPFDASGQPLGGEIQVNDYTAGAQLAPSAGMDAAGHFVVAWQSPRASITSVVAAHAFAADGTTMGNEVVLSAPNTDSATAPALLVPPSGDGLLVWQTVNDGDADGIEAQRFTFADGVTTTTAPAVTTTTTAAVITTTTTISVVTTTTAALTTTTTIGAPGCGDPVSSAPLPAITSADALFALRASVLLATCPPCVCDVDNSGVVNASDALRILRFAVGSTAVLTCPDC